MSVFKESQENDEERKRQEIEGRTRKRIDCEKRAFDIIQELIEPGISAEYLLQVANLIGPSHYVDIVEERSITKICGYPLCNNTVKTVLKQKYHISTKSNKIYDISERKKFCSNQCFKASKYFENQISSSPVWARQLEPKVEFQLLTGSSGAIGDEVVVLSKEQNDMKIELERLKKLDREGKDTDNTDLSSVQIDTSTFDEHMRCTREKCHQEKPNNKSQADDKARASTATSDEQVRCKGEECYPEEVDKIKERKSNMEEPDIKDIKSNMEDIESGLSHLTINSSPTHSESPKSHPEPSNLKNPKQTISNQPSESKSQYMLRLLEKRKKHLSKMSVDVPLSVGSNSQTKKRNFCPKINTVPKRKVTPLRLLSDIIKEWVTENTKMYLKRQSLSVVCASMEEHYNSLCQKLEEKEREKEKLEELLSKKLQLEDSKSQMKPLPDYENLKEEVRKEEIKVREFYRGNFCTEGDLMESEKDYMEEDKAPVVMPTVDSHDQMIIRRRIILERLMKVLPEVLSPLRLSILDVTEEIRELVHTFKFTSSNILFKPAQWTMVAIILLKLISNRHKKLEESFTNPSAVKYVDVILKALGENRETFQTVIDSIVQ